MSKSGLEAVRNILPRLRAPNTLHRPYGSLLKCSCVPSGSALSHHRSASCPPKYHIPSWQHRQGQHHTTRSLSSASNPSSTSSSSYEEPPPPPSKPNSRRSLRNHVKPFLLLCHPDTQTSSKARSVNLAAVQTLNGLIDAVETLCERATEDPSKQSTSSNVGAGGGGRVELKSTYEIEFLLTVPEPAGVRKPKKKDRKLTRRSVEITFPRFVREGVRESDSREARMGAAQLRQWTRSEIGKLLRVAGLKVPPKGEEEDVFVEDLLLEEMDLVDGGDDRQRRRRGGTTRYADLEEPISKGRISRFNASRHHFMRSIDWKEHRRMYDDAFRAAEADVATEGSMNKRGRKERMVSEICGRVRVIPPTGWDPVQGEESEVGAVGERKDGSTEDDTHYEREDGLDVIQQLIAIRRLSLLLLDNFHELEMEDMGRMWDNLTLILTPPRDNPSSSAVRKRKKRGIESGFKFSYGADGKVTVYCPIDFRDEELIEELTRNVWDFYNWVEADNWLDQLYPDMRV